MKYVKLAFCVIILISGCNRDSIIDKKWEKVSFPELSKVNIDSLKIKPVNYFPVAMLRKDSLLIIKNNRSDTIFRVFSLPKFKYLGWFGMIGKGPNEFVVPPQMRNYQGTIQLAGVSKILFINLSDGIVNNKFKVERGYTVPGKIHPLNDVFTLNDNKFYGITYSEGTESAQERNELVFFDYNTYKTGSTINFPRSLHKGLPLESFLYYKFIAVSPKNDKFAFFYYQYPLIRIFDKYAKLQKEIWVDGLPKQIILKNLMNARKSNLGFACGYYGKVIATEKYLYAMFCNDKGIKLNDGGNYSYGKELIGNPELHVFSWEGEPVYRIQLRKGISAFELSKDERYLYSTDLNINDKIYIYDLKH